MVRYSELKGLYSVEKTIGCGGFAKVKLATHLATGERVAIKVMDKILLGDDLPRVSLELKALKTFAHQHICKLYQVIESEQYIFIIIEYCSGGELFDHIVEKVLLTESESRIFFRQIVLTVAYMHDLGYAHRDLKPENVLLDKDQSLKLIDFGLCAKPEAGMTSPLYTSCGSPTYAAPELLLGNQYLGTEVDVWAMGVLLYTLLTGNLPFNDNNINGLYKKILNGKYVEPEFLSADSKRLIRSMLQVDSQKRITVKELLSDPWLTKGTTCPLKITSENFKEKDKDCVALMAQYNAVTPEEMWKHLSEWKYDYHTATYLLLLGRKKRGLLMRLNPNVIKHPFTAKVENSKNTKPLRPLNINIANLPGTPVCTTPLPNYSALRRPGSCGTPKKFISENSNGDSTPNGNYLHSPHLDKFVEPRGPSSSRKRLKRIRSPNLDGDCSPVPAKKSTPGPSTPVTPDSSRPTPSSSEKSGSARRVLENIGKSFYRVRHALAPKKLNGDGILHPIILTNKEVCNVSTTQCRDPELVISELSKALEKKGIQCERKGFTIRGKVEPNVLYRFGGCSFELEICFLPPLSPGCNFINSTPTPTKTLQKNVTFTFLTPTMAGCLSSPKTDRNNGNATESDFPNVCIGIRRKRLKGDFWCYKKVCELVLAFTATDLNERIETVV